MIPPDSFRIRLSLPQPRKRLPTESIAMLLTWLMTALVAGPPSPEAAPKPVPAIVVMVPFETLRTRPLLESAMKRLPAESTATPLGPFRAALVAGPPSPEKPSFPLPATVVMIPLDTFRTLLLK